MLTQRHTIDPEFDCPGDNITCVCTISTNIDPLQVVWMITLDEEEGNVTLDANTVLGMEQSVAMNMFIILEEFVNTSHAVSRFTIVPEIDVTLPRILLQCSVTGVVSSSVITIDVVNPTGKHEWNLHGQSDHHACAAIQSTHYPAHYKDLCSSIGMKYAAIYTVTVQYMSTCKI